MCCCFYFLFGCSVIVNTVVADPIDVAIALARNNDRSPCKGNNPTKKIKDLRAPDEDPPQK